MLCSAASELGLHCLHISSKQVSGLKRVTVKILKFGTPQTAIIVLKTEKFDVTLH